MKLDYMVYGRGLELEQGFALQAAPPYVRQELLLHLSEFLELGDDRLAAQFPAGARDPWADSYLFVCQPPPLCCALVRICRAEGDTPGTWLREVRGKTVWSLEGWCAPFEQRDAFFALVPSILRWMAEDSSTLYNRHRLRRIPQPTELPEIYVCNPYAEKLPAFAEDPPPLRTPLSQLCQAIRLAAQPFGFLFGPLAPEFARRIGGRYRITQVFSETESTPPAQTADPFDKLEYAAVRETVGATHTYRLRLHLQKTQRHKWERTWGIYEPAASPTGGGDLFAGQPETADAEDGIPMAQLLAESELIRDFAKRMGWQTAPESASADLRYRFRKEE